MLLELCTFLLLISKSMMYVIKIHPWSCVFAGFSDGSVCFLKRKKTKTKKTCLPTKVWSLGQEDPLEKGMATHSSILAWRIPWTEEPRGLQSTGVAKKSGMT